MQHATYSSHPRFVHRKRKAKLRKRGVELFPTVDRGVYVWYESDLSYDVRTHERQLAGWARSRTAKHKLLHLLYGYGPPTWDGTNMASARTPQEVVGDIERAWAYLMKFDAYGCPLRSELDNLEGKL